MRKQSQSEFGFTNWGGRRKGAGRKPRDPAHVADHDPRPRLSPHTPVHVTLRLAPKLPNLRTRFDHAIVLRALVASSKRGFRVVHYAVLSNHMHLICEVGCTQDLSRGMQGLTVRVARRLNREWRRRGTVFQDHYYVHPLKTPREVRHALAYVLQNARKHGVPLAGTIDPLSSARWFDGWNVDVEQVPFRPNPLPLARSWLLETGWRRTGPLDLTHSPSQEPRMRRNAIPAESKCTGDYSRALARSATISGSSTSSTSVRGVTP